MVIAPANTGRDKSSSTAVIRVAQVKSGIACSDTPGARMLNVVTIKLIAPRVLLIPARWRAKMAMSTEGPLWLWSPDSGG